MRCSGSESISEGSYISRVFCYLDLCWVVPCKEPVLYTDCIIGLLRSKELSWKVWEFGLKETSGRVVMSCGTLSAFLTSSREMDCGLELEQMIWILTSKVFLYLHVPAEVLKEFWETIVWYNVSSIFVFCQVMLQIVIGVENVFYCNEYAIRRWPQPTTAESVSSYLPHTSTALTAFKVGLHCRH